MMSLNSFIISELKENISYELMDINEVGGLYDGQVELATLIANDIEEKSKTEKSNSIELSYDGNELKMSNIFFNELKVYVNFSNRNMLMYAVSSINDIENNKLNYDSASNKLKHIEMTINLFRNIDISNWHRLRSKICHELNHCYTFYEIISDDAKHINDIDIPNEYSSALHKWKNNVYDKMIDGMKTSHNDELSVAKRITSLLIYSLTTFERNAFLSEIDSYLFNNKGKRMKDIKSIENVLKDCNEYNLYKYENVRILNEIYNNWSNEQKDVFRNTYNDIYNTNKSFNKIIYLLNKKNEYTIKKLEKNIELIILNYKDLDFESGNFINFPINYNGSIISEYIQWF